MPQGHATALYDHSGSLQGGSMGDPSDPVTARWLQSAGLQHLASPLASSSGMDHRLIPNFFNQGYTQSYDDKQRLFKMLKSMNLGIEPGSEPFTPTAQSSAPSAETFLSPELRGEFSAGLLDLHSMDDTELFNEYAGTEPFETSPFMSSGDKGFANDSDTVAIGKQKVPAENMFRAPLGEKESIGKENNLAKIKVVVRKRPLNKKELARKEEDIVSVNDNVWLTVHEPKLKVDLTAYVEKHDFVFDAILDDHVSNDEVYRVTVEPIVPTIFQRTKATCFAYGQTGSGKTYTMQPLPLRACEDILKMMNQPYYEDQGFRLWLSFFEIYGGKLYDLLNDRKKLCMREDGRQQVCIVGLCEFEVSDIQSVKEYIEKGSGTRSTGSTGANEESSRSHAILQLTIKKHPEGKDSKAAKAARIVGKLSFIDLAGSERGADTTDNDRQTRMEGAEINKSLLALKECIRALDNDQIHIPFRGSKLTEVLRDSFVGNSRTVMISCVSPNSGSCEHTLNTLRYADRVKGLSKSSNLRKDQVSSSTTQIPRESSSLTLPSGESKDFSDHNQAMSFESSRRSVETQQYGNQSEELDKNSSGLPSVMPYGTREENGYSNYIENRANTRESIAGSASQKNSSTNLSSLDINGEEKAQKVSPTRRKTREDKPERQPNWGSKEESRADGYNAVRKQQYQSRDELSNNQGPTKVKESTTSAYDNDINAILQEEEALIAAHRKEIEDTMELVREEMQLLTEVEQPGSLIDDYVSKLSIVLSHKAAGLVSLQARLARFQKRLKEHEILSMKKTLNSK